MLRFGEKWKYFKNPAAVDLQDYNYFFNNKKTLDMFRPESIQWQNVATVVSKLFITITKWILLSQDVEKI